MRQNVGHFDAYLRLMAGFLLLGWGLRTPNRRWGFLLTFLGAGRLAEGLTRWCPLLAALGVDSLTPEERSVALGHLGPRYGRISHNPYRPYPGEDMTDFRPSEPRGSPVNGAHPPEDRPQPAAGPGTSPYRQTR